MVELKAVLWDMDGTLVDSEPIWKDEEQCLMSQAGLEWLDETAASYVGQPIHLTVAGMREHGLNLPESEVIATLIENVSARLGGHIPWLPGAQELLASVAPLYAALVTMSHSTVARPLLAAVPDVFSAVITGDSGVRSKPDPEPYLAAAAQLGVEPAECIAIEDSLPGVASAVAAGAVTIGVEHIISLKDSGAHAVLSTLHGISMDTLRRIHAQHHARR